MTAKVRRPLFDGVREVRALWFDVALIGEAEARRRVLSHWQCGARLHRVLDGYLLELPRARLARCAGLDGLPFCEVGGVLSSAPLEEDERGRTPAGGLWLVRGAEARLITPLAADQVDPSAWLELGRIPLREPLQAPLGHAGATIAPPSAAKPVREIIGAAIPTPSAAREAFLRDAAARQDGPGAGRASAPAKLAMAAAALSFGVAALVGGWIGAMLRPGRGSDAGTRRPPAAPSPLAERLSRLAAKLTALSGFAKVAGWRQADYLRKMADMFNSGDLQEALRHAIPLSALNKAAKRQAFGTPRRRAKLSITGGGGEAAGINVDHATEHYLRQTYRRSFERLDREGRIDEAAFVLAELLGAGVEATDYLEAKGRVKQAAELAETLELPAQIAVRLWCAAGDLRRAALLATLHHAFDDAVRALERKKAPGAAELRRLWARDLAARGELSEAAEAIWPLAGQRDQALEWLLQAERAGGSLGLRAMCKKLTLHPAGLAQSAAAIEALLAAPGDGGAVTRARLAQQLLSLQTHSPATRRLAAELLRHVIPERVAGKNQLQNDDCKKLLKLAEDGVMKADLPPLNLPALPAGAALRGLPMPLTAGLHERGLLAIHDARHLPDGQYLLALGEGGVIRVDGAGRQLAHYPVPAHYLVLASNKQRALALARRDSTLRVSRIDLTAGKVSDWITQPFEFWAEQYDGLTWSAVLGNRLLAIDTSQDGLAVSWQVADLPGKIIALSEERHTQTILLRNADELEQWRYTLPARRLTQRDSWPADAQEYVVLPNANQNEPLTIELKREPRGAFARVKASATANSFVIEVDADAAAPEFFVRANWLLVLTSEYGAARCLLVDLQSGKVCADLNMQDSESAQVRLQDGHILMFDLAGRLLDIDCASGYQRTLTLN